MFRGKKTKLFIILVPVVAVISALAWYLHRTNIPVLEPAGQIGDRERGLIIVAILLSVIVVVPTFALAIFIAVKYRESNHQAKKNIKYNPDWDHSRLYESIWWGVPMLIITILSVITWVSSHALDPYKALASGVKPITVQVVAMDWKWLFIYPQQHIASVNLIEMPVNTPVNFEITSDAVMNSFWIPQLGGQIYAMPGMSGQLHLIANRDGSFYGSPANIAGTGFADMTFTAKSVPLGDFNYWVSKAQNSKQQLDMPAYQQLKKPSENVPVTYYSKTTTGLYNEIIVSYLTPFNSQYFIVPEHASLQSGYIQ